MSALEDLRLMGVTPRLGAGGSLKLSGLTGLPTVEVVRAKGIATENKAAIIEELQEEGTETWHCWCCGGRTYFVNLVNRMVCATCHPPVDPVRFPVVADAP